MKNAPLRNVPALRPTINPIIKRLESDERAQEYHASRKSVKSKLALSIAADPQRMQQALEAFDPVSYSEGIFRKSTDQSRVDLYVTFCAQLHDKTEPWPLTRLKLDMFTAALIASGYKTANDYSSAVKSYARKNAKIQMTIAEEYSFTQNIARASRRGFFDHEPAEPVTLSQIVRKGTDFSGKFVLNRNRAIALIVFYFGLRQAEKEIIVLNKNLKLIPDTEPKKFVVDLTKYILKSNKVRIIQAHCICAQLKQDFPEALLICVCKCYDLLIANNTRHLAVVPWPAIMSSVADHEKTHGIRVGCLMHVLTLERKLGWCNCMLHLRWASASMLLYYARMRAKTSCRFRKLQFCLATSEILDEGLGAKSSVLQTILDNITGINQALHDMGIPKLADCVENEDIVQEVIQQVIPQVSLQLSQLEDFSERPGDVQSFTPGPLDDDDFLMQDMNDVLLVPQEEDNIWNIPDHILNTQSDEGGTTPLGRVHERESDLWGWIHGSPTQRQGKSPMSGSEKLL